MPHPNWRTTPTRGDFEYVREILGREPSDPDYFTIRPKGCEHNIIDDHYLSLSGLISEADAKRFAAVPQMEYKLLKMMPIINQLADALKWEIEKTPLNTHVVAEAALEAAAPFLEE